MTKRTYKTHNGLKEWHKLEEDWDSYGALPPEPKAIEMASRLLRLFGNKPQPVPVNHGGFQFEFQGDGLELELEFTPLDDGKWEVSFYLTDEDKRNGRNSKKAWEESEIVLISGKTGDDK